MIGVIELLVVGLVLIFIVLAVGRFVFPKRPSPGADEPACGNCGYSTKGISELKCPECGADLTVVGIVKLSDQGAGLAGCLWPLLLTISIIPLAVVGYIVLGLIVPHYSQQSTHFDLRPFSDEYAEIIVDVDLTVMTPPGTSTSYSGFDLTSSMSTPPVTDITFGDKGTKVRAKRIAIEAIPNNNSNTSGLMNYAPRFEVNPTTKIASWTEAKGTRHTTQGPVSEKDVLAYLAYAGADTSNPDVITEARQLTAMIHGMISGTSAFQLQSFSNGGYGSGGTGQLGPVWMLPAYAGAWLLIWIVGILWLARRRRSQSATP
ncbi:MAG: hypothetical protein AB8C95_08950 [Phycisphaeraceae bacterium]